MVSGLYENGFDMSALASGITSRARWTALDNGL